MQICTCSRSNCSLSTQAVDRIVQGQYPTWSCPKTPRGTIMMREVEKVRDSRCCNSGESSRGDGQFTSSCPGQRPGYLRFAPGVQHRLCCNRRGDLNTRLVLTSERLMLTSERPMLTSERPGRASDSLTSERPVLMLSERPHVDPAAVTNGHWGTSRNENSNLTPG
jgi:hypothetical protein